jgi:hypothetical protein
MTNNMKAMELNDEQLAIVTGGDGSNSGNQANVLQEAEAQSYVATWANNISYSNIGNAVAINASFIRQKQFFF